MQFFRKPRLLFALFLLAIMLVFLFVSLGYTGATRIGPLIVAILCTVVLLVIVASEVFPTLGGRLRVNIMDAFARSRLASQASSDEEAIETGNKGLAILVVWITSFVISIFLLGFLISIPLLTLIFLKFGRNISWPKSIVVTIAASGGLYILFPLLLNLRLFEGILFGAIPH